MARDSSHLVIITSDTRPYIPQVIVPILPQRLEGQPSIREAVYDWMDAFFEAIEEHACPECACLIEHVAQDGPPINALPCGHRLGLGKAADFASVFEFAVAEG